MRTTSERGRRMLMNFEGTVHHVYRDQAGVPTVCVGHMMRPGDEAVVENGVTDEECETFLRNDLKSAEAVVNEHVTVPISQNMFDALVSFQFNTGALPKSSVLKYTNARAFQLAAEAFMLWCKRKDPKTGQLVIDQGLLGRRKSESVLFLTPDKTPSDAVDTLMAAVAASQFDLTDLIDWHTGAATPVAPDKGEA